MLPFAIRSNSKTSEQPCLGSFELADQRASRVRAADSVAYYLIESVVNPFGRRPLPPRSPRSEAVLKFLLCKLGATSEGVREHRLKIEAEVRSFIRKRCARIGFVTCVVHLDKKVAPFLLPPARTSAYPDSPDFRASLLPALLVRQNDPVTI